MTAGCSTFVGNLKRSTWKEKLHAMQGCLVSLWVSASRETSHSSCVLPATGDLREGGGVTAYATPTTISPCVAHQRNHILYKGASCNVQRGVRYTIECKPTLACVFGVTVNVQHTFRVCTNVDE